MKTKHWIAVLGGVLLLLLAASILGISLLLAKFEVVNNSSLKKFHVSSIWGNLFLYNNKYLDSIDSVTIVYTDEPQSTFQQVDADNNEVMSLGLSKTDKNVTIHLRYAPEHFDTIQSSDNWFDLDVMASICLIMENKESNYATCYDKALEHYYWTELNAIPTIISKQIIPNFNLIKKVHAGCLGTVYCGQETWARFCIGGTNDGDLCTYDSNCPGGYCSQNYLNCNLESNTMDCDRFTDQTYCTTNTAPQDVCYNTCNPIADDSCYWYSGTGTTTTPPSSPSCSVSSLPYVEMDCDNYGLYGNIYELATKRTWTGYTCGPTANNPAGTCGWWNASWVGYFNAPTDGYYHFLVKMFPQGGFGIDLDNDGDMDNNCGAGAGSSIKGQRYLNYLVGANPAYRPQWMRVFETGVDPRSDCGIAGCDCWEDFDARIFCEEGRHLQYADRNNYATTNTDEGQTQWWGGIYPWDSTYSGSEVPNSEKPTGFPKIPPYRTASINRSPPNSSASLAPAGSECIYNTRGNYLYTTAYDGTVSVDNGQASWTWVRRYLTEGSHKVQFWYNYNLGSSSNTTRHFMDFYYKGPGMANFVKTSGNLDNNAACPFSPCPTIVCNPAPPDAPVLATPAIGTRIYDTTTVPLTWTMGSFGAACPSNSDGLKLFYGTDPNAVNNATYANTTIASGTVVSLPYTSRSQNITVPVNGRLYYWKIMASNGDQTSSSSVWNFYAPTAADVVFERSLDCPPASSPSLLTGTGFTSSFQLRPPIPPYAAYSATAFESNRNFFNTIPSNTSYTISASTLPADWRFTCNRTIGAFTTPQLVSTSNPIKVYVEKSAKAWFQVAFGDVGSKTNSVIAEVPFQQYFLTPSTGQSSGVAIANNEVTNLGEGYFAPSDRLWQAEGTGLVKTEDWFGYFKRTYEIVQQTSSSFVEDSSIYPSLALDTTMLTPSNTVPANRIMDSYLEEAVYYLNNNAVIDDDFLVPNSPVTKHTIFVNGNLTVNAATIETEGEFLAFIVSGDIVFNATTRNIEGVFIANGSLTVNDAVTETGAARRFIGEGIFAGIGGVTLNRDLNSAGSPADDLANNTTSAELFTYRPDFAANAPRGLKRIPVRWREIEPQSIDGL